MSCECWPRGLSRREREELRAQEIASIYLVKGCERALADLRCNLTESEEPRDLRIALRASQILEDILGSWAETLAVLRAASADGQQEESPTFTRH